MAFFFGVRSRQCASRRVFQFIARAVSGSRLHTKAKGEIMPLLHLCAYSGCQHSIPYEEKYCEDHREKGEARDKNARRERQKAVDARRGSAASRGYGYRWRIVAKRFLQKHPYCVECYRQGRIRPATDVDHIVPHRGDAKLMWNPNNWQPLCHECHSRKTASEDGAFGNKTRLRDERKDVPSVRSTLRFKGA